MRVPLGVPGGAFLALSLLCLILMEERPLRGSVMPADPPGAPAQ